MIPPKKILGYVQEHWSIIEKLVNVYSATSFNAQDLQNLFKQHYPDWPADRIFRESQKALQLDIVIPLAKSSQLELNRALLEFAQYLLQEQTLGLAEEIEVLVRDLPKQSNKLAEICQHADNLELRRITRLMDDRVRKIVKLLRHNENAIYNLVDEAKTQTGQLSLKRRYQAVLDAFDTYIEPMLNMVEVNGLFVSTFSNIELQVSEQIDWLKTTGLMSQERELLVQFRSRILDMHWLARESLRHSVDVLMPLREELRKNTLITQRASELLSAMRKRGVDAVLSELAIHFSSDVQRFSLGTVNQITAYMAELTDYQDDAYTLPDAASIAPYTPKSIPDYHQVRSQWRDRKVSKAQPLIGFLTDHYPDLDSDELLYLYQKMANDPDIQVEHDTAQSRVTIGNVAVTLYPFNEVRPHE